MAAKASEISGQQKSFDALYAALRSGLGPGVVGKFVVINIRSGRYLIAPTSKAALALAEREFGSTDWCWTRRIGPR